MKKSAGRFEGLQWKLGQELLALRSHGSHRVGQLGEGPSGILCGSEPESLALPLSCIISLAPADVLFERIQRRGRENPPIERDAFIPVVRNVPSADSGGDGAFRRASGCRPCLRLKLTLHRSRSLT